MGMERLRRTGENGGIRGQGGKRGKGGKRGRGKGRKGENEGECGIRGMGKEGRKRETI